MRIEVSKLGKQAEALASFLEPRLSAKVSRSESKIELEAAPDRGTLSNRFVKTYVKRFLHNTGARELFRVIADDEGLRIVRVGEAAAEAGA